MSGMDPQAIMACIAGELVAATEGHSKFYPYTPNVDLAYLHDSPYRKLTVTMTMLVGKESMVWPGRSYFLPGKVEVTEAYLEPLAYDASAALSSFLKAAEIQVGE